MKNVKMLVIPVLLVLLIGLTPITTILSNQNQNPVATAQNLLQQSDISQLLDKSTTSDNNNDAQRF